VSLAVMPESKTAQKRGNPGMRQPMISTFFSQTAKGPQTAARSEPLSSSSSPIDLTISDGEEPPAKKPKMEHKKTLVCTTPERRLQNLPTPASRWRYDPTPSPEKRLVDPEAKKRRELFAKQLLEEDSPLVDPTGASSDGHGLPSDHADGELVSSEAESDNKFKHLQELFARKTEQKKNRKAAQERPSKKRAELGPSGEPYTALELQV
jgi:DNA mismatch repair protein MSH3